jgi:hypothetical protein
MAGEILASLADINTHLPDDKIRMDDADDDALQIDAQRLIRASLTGVFTPATIYSWTTPDDTPELIRGIAGRFIAAKWYAERYAEDIPDASSYAQALYNEALSMIQEIRAGTIVVTDDLGQPIQSFGASASDASFWPNDSTSPAPFFSMGMEFA